MVDDFSRTSKATETSRRRVIRRQTTELTDLLTSFLEESAGGGRVVCEGCRHEKLQFRLLVENMEHLPLVAEDFCQRYLRGLGCTTEDIRVNGHYIEVKFSVHGLPAKSR